MSLGFQLIHVFLWRNDKSYKYGVGLTGEVANLNYALNLIWAEELSLSWIAIPFGLEQVTFSRLLRFSYLIYCHAALK